MSGKKEKEEK